MNEYNVELILTGLVSLGIMQNAFKNGKFTCRKFLLNAYLYIFLSLLLVSISVKIFETHNIPSLIDVKNQGLARFLVLLLITIGLLITVMSWPSKNLFSKHFLWLLWIGVMGYTLYPLFKIDKALFSIVKYQVLFVMTALTILTALNPKLINLKWWGPKLFVMLIGLIVVTAFSLIVPGFYTSKIHYFLSYFSLILFSFYMMYDTKRLLVKARQCVKADYINDSIGSVLDGLNIFTNLFGIQSHN
jgi:FtsH-binding integral membrane protein